MIIVTRGAILRWRSQTEAKPHNLVNGQTANLSTHVADLHFVPYANTLHSLKVKVMIHKAQTKNSCVLMAIRSA